MKGVQHYGPVYDPESGKNLVQISAGGKTGRIATLIIGLKR